MIAWEKIYFAGGTNFYPEMADDQCDVAIYPMYTVEDVEEVLRVLPARALILVHTSAAGAKPFADVPAPEVPDMPITSLEIGLCIPWDSADRARRWRTPPPPDFLKASSKGKAAGSG
jgi:hypothetical protein